MEWNKMTEKVLNEYVEGMEKVKTQLKVLQVEKMACLECSSQHQCDFAFDPYNFNTEPGIDCLAAK